MTLKGAVLSQYCGHVPSLNSGQSPWRVQPRVGCWMGQTHPCFESQNDPGHSCDAAGRSAPKISEYGEEDSWQLCAEPSVDATPTLTTVTGGPPKHAGEPTVLQALPAAAWVATDT